MAALTFGNVHGVYKPGNVKLRPEILKRVPGRHHRRPGASAGSKPLDLVFHGGSGSLPEEISAAVDYGVVKMNVDTDTQYAFTRPVADWMLKNYDGVLKIDGEVGNKKQYDPRAWGKEAEAGMAARVVEACQNLRSAGYPPGLSGLTPHPPRGRGAQLPAQCRNGCRAQRIVVRRTAMLLSPRPPHRPESCPYDRPAGNPETFLPDDPAAMIAALRIARWRPTSGRGIPDLVARVGGARRGRRSPPTIRSGLRLCPHGLPPRPRRAASLPAGAARARSRGATSRTAASCARWPPSPKPPGPSARRTSGPVHRVPARLESADAPVSSGSDASLTPDDLLAASTSRFAGRGRGLAAQHAGGATAVFRIVEH
jgi:hypothetical protein